ncbi:unnamed protein product [Chilo suppressalis]|uniref:Tetraspanin n=1 Tax=Chilo suppressalis TaxID=168631 RepID=A0ABN8AYR9_CHISP|nr:unnamed protein product [Chilo suppressalis]
MFKKILKNILLWSNAAGIMIGVCAIVSYLVLVAIRGSLRLPFNLGLLDTALNALVIAGSTLIVVNLLGFCSIIIRNKTGKWLMTLYTVTISITTIMQIYILVILFVHRSARNEGIFSTITSVMTPVNTTYDVRRSNTDNITSPLTATLTKPLTFYENQAAYKLDINKTRNRRDVDIPVDSIINDDHKTNNSKFKYIKNMLEVIPLSTYTIVGQSKNKPSNYTQFDGYNKTNVFLSSNDSVQYSNIISHYVKEKVDNVNGIVKSTVVGARDNVKKSLTDMGSSVQGSVNIGSFWIKTNERDNNLLKPILGGLSKPILYLSKSSSVLACFVIINVVNVLYVAMTICFCIMQHYYKRHNELTK